MLILKAQLELAKFVLNSINFEPTEGKIPPTHRPLSPQEKAKNREQRTVTYGFFQYGLLKAVS